MCCLVSLPNRGKRALSPESCTDKTPARPLLSSSRSRSRRTRAKQEPSPSVTAMPPQRTRRRIELTKLDNFIANLTEEHKAAILGAHQRVQEGYQFNTGGFSNVEHKLLSSEKKLARLVGLPRDENDEFLEKVLEVIFTEFLSSLRNTIIPFELNFDRYLLQPSQPTHPPSQPPSQPPHPPSQPPHPPSQPLQPTSQSSSQSSPSFDNTMDQGDDFHDSADTGERHEELGQQEQQLGERVAELGERLAQFDQRFAEQDQRLDQRFAEQDQRLDQRFAEQDRRLARLLDRRFAEMTDQMNALAGRVTALEEAQNP